MVWRSVALALAGGALHCGMVVAMGGEQGVELEVDPVSSATEHAQQPDQTLDVGTPVEQDLDANLDLLAAVDEATVPSTADMAEVSTTHGGSDLPGSATLLPQSDLPHWRKATMPYLQPGARFFAAGDPNAPETPNAPLPVGNRRGTMTSPVVAKRFHLTELDDHMNLIEVKPRPIIRQRVDRTNQSVLTTNIFHSSKFGNWRKRSSTRRRGGKAVTKKRGLRRSKKRLMLKKGGRFKAVKAV